MFLEIAHNIFSSFDFNPTSETWAVFLDISRAFYKVLQEALIKLKSRGISGNLLKLIKIFCKWKISQFC